MEILLTKDVPNIGKKNDLIVVGDGLALNYLLPQRQAIVATPAVRKKYAEQIRLRAEEREKEKTLKEALATALKGMDIRFKRKTTKTDNLYSAITEKIISEELEKEHGLKLSDKDIEIPTPIKSIGTHAIRIKMGGKQQDISVIVEKEVEKSEE